MYTADSQLSSVCDIAFNLNFVLLNVLANAFYRYENGDRLSPEHEKTILERLLPYHPQFEKKMGCGIDFITVCLLSNAVVINFSLHDTIGSFVAVFCL